jgi:hypothetical protein
MKRRGQRRGCLIAIALGFLFIASGLFFGIPLLAVIYQFWFGG